jgi:predicted Rossmann fold nucleotide-binding protein DprA/Smf involved in DNA uptake
MNAPNRDLREIVREEPVMRGRILELLATSPRTVPEIAAAIACPTHEVMFWVMAMRRYGHVREVKGVGGDGYFRYEAIAKDPS